MGINNATEDKVAEYLSLATATSERIANSVEGVNSALLIQAPVENEWSVLDILNHLRACEEVWMHSVYAMLAHDKPILKEIHPRQWIKKQRNPYTSLSFEDSFKVFRLGREALLISLQALSLEDWAREGRIDRKPHTVFSHVRRMVLHEQSHCDEIALILGK